VIKLLSVLSDVHGFKQLLELLQICSEIDVVERLFVALTVGRSQGLSFGNRVFIRCDPSCSSKRAALLGFSLLNSFEKISALILPLIFVLVSFCLHLRRSSVKFVELLELRVGNLYFLFSSRMVRSKVTEWFETRVYFVQL
jgi:hypothetical protein